MSNPQDSIQTIHGHIKYVAETQPKSRAILAPGRDFLSYEKFWQLILKTKNSLNKMGFGLNHRIALLAPQSAEAACATIAISSVTTCVPINPGIRISEILDDLKRTKCTTIVIVKGFAEELAKLCVDHQIAVIELVPELHLPAGSFSLVFEGSHQSIAEESLASPDHFAIILQTSGTTSNPKVVPIKHSSLMFGAVNAKNILGLTSADRCLSMIPLFHMAGISATTLTSLAAGASLIYTSGFLRSEVAQWIRSLKPTWYSAVPTIHQALLEIAQSEKDIAKNYFRFLRSGAAAMPTAMISQLESTFGVPVIEAYAMTECFQIATNPMPPQKRKVGSVGIAAGVEIAILDDEGKAQVLQQPGEIAIRGPNVFSAYENNSEATQESFLGSWFKTGDIGYLDNENYLFITGRKKELINRGGEKISPRFVEEVLLQHPAVLEVAVFGLKDEYFGEEVCAIVKSRDPGSVTEAALLDFAEQKLSAETAPHFLYIVESIPKGPTGKVQRSQLSKLFQNYRKIDQSASSAVDIDKVSIISRQILRIWSEDLQRPVHNLDDNFFQIGGSSITAAIVAGTLRKEFGIQITPRLIFDAPTPSALAKKIAQLLQEPKKEQDQILKTTREGLIPLTIQQDQLCAVNAAIPNAFNITYGLQISGPLNTDTLKKCFEKIISRHEVLRTSFPKQGRRFQKISPSSHFDLSFDDLTGLADSEKEAAAKEIGTSENLKAFDSIEGPLWRTRLIQTHKDECILCFTFSHIICDRWTLGNIVRELIDLYCSITTGAPSLLVADPVQMADYAVWQRKHIASVSTKRARYWEKALAGLGPAKSISKDPIPVNSKFQFLCHQVKLDRESLLKIKTRVSEEKMTLFPLLMAMFGKVWTKHTGETDIAIGVPVAERETPELGSAVGCLMSLILVRMQIDQAQSIEKLFRQVSTSFLDSVENLLPIGLMGGLRGRSRVFLNLQVVPPHSIEQIPGSNTKIDMSKVLLEKMHIPEIGLSFNKNLLLDLSTQRTAQDIDINCIIREIDGSLYFSVWYRSDMNFTAPSIQSLFEEYINALKNYGDYSTLQFLKSV